MRDVTSTLNTTFSPSSNASSPAQKPTHRNTRLS
jgi:hypothetical protein